MPNSRTRCRDHGSRLSGVAVAPKMSEDAGGTVFVQELYRPHRGPGSRRLRPDMYPRMGAYRGVNMLARKTWYVLAAALVVFASWLVFQPQSIVYSETERDGVLYVSKVDCGVGVAMVFAERFDQGVPGPSTQADCLRYGRARVAELAGLVSLAGALWYIGTKYGKEPPRPIRTELPDLPSGEAIVEGRRKRSTPST